MPGSQVPLASAGRPSMPERRLFIGRLGDMQGAAAPHSPKRSRRYGDLGSRAFALAIIIPLGLLLRMHQIGAASLWYDEIFSAYWIHPPLSYLWTDGLVIETTPPLYYTLLKLW